MEINSSSVFTINRILYSIGKVLKDLFNNPIYINPNQQSTELPCFFVQLIPNEHLIQGIGKRAEYKLNIDVIHLVDYNKNDTYTYFYDIVNKLDANLDNIPLLDIGEGEEEVKPNGSFGCYNRSFSTEQGKLTYKFNSNIIVRKVDTDILENTQRLKRLILNLSLKGDKDGKTYKTTIR